MYVYLTRDQALGKNPKSLRLFVTKPMYYAGRWWGSVVDNELPILAPQDKPVPMLLGLGDVKLPGWLCYTCDGFMDFKYETVQRILGYEHS